MGHDFLYEVKDNVATITFNRPDVLNALTFEVYAQFRDLMEDLRYDDSVKVVVLTGQGKGFCSGGDVHDIIGELLKRDVKGHLDFTRMTGAVVQNMRLLDKPIIAALFTLLYKARLKGRLALRPAFALAFAAFLTLRVHFVRVDFAELLTRRIVLLALTREAFLEGRPSPFGEGNG